MCNFEITISESGDDGVEETLLSIPNRTVKLYSVDGTAWETVWESRTLPGSCRKHQNNNFSAFFRIENYFTFTTYYIDDKFTFQAEQHSVNHLVGKIRSMIKCIDRELIKEAVSK